MAWQLDVHTQARPARARRAAPSCSRARTHHARARRPQPERPRRARTAVHTLAATHRAWRIVADVRREHDRARRHDHGHSARCAACRAPRAACACASSLTAPRLVAALVLLVVLSLLLRTTRAARPLLDRRGAVGRHRVAPALRHPRRAAPGRLAAAVLPDAARLDRRSSATARRARTGSRVALRAADDPRRLWAGRLLFDVRGRAGSAALCAALNPFLTYYAQETRMYALVALLSIVTARRRSRWPSRERRRGLAVASFAVLARAARSTRTTGALFFVVGTVVAFARAVAALATSGPRSCATALHGLRRWPRSLYLPWVPTLVFQAAPHRRAVVGPPGLGRPLGARWRRSSAAPRRRWPSRSSRSSGVAAVLRVAPGRRPRGAVAAGAGDPRAARGVRRRRDLGLARLAAVAGVGDALLRRRSSGR